MNSQEINLSESHKYFGNTLFSFFFPLSTENELIHIFHISITFFFFLLQSVRENISETL